MAKRLALRTPEVGDSQEFLQAVTRSRKLHGTMVSPPNTKEKYSGWLDSQSLAANRSFFVCHNGAIAGVVNVTNIVGGNFCSAYLGYYAFADYAQRGVMTWGVDKVCATAFKEMGLHRLEANIQPGNEASIALVKRCGFQYEGYSPRYLKIRGRWRDHERWTLLKS